MTLLLQPPEYHNSGCEPPHLIAYFTFDSALTMSVTQSLNKKIIPVSRPVETSWILFIHRKTLGVVLYQTRHSHQETAREKKEGSLLKPFLLPSETMWTCYLKEFTSGNRNEHFILKEFMPNPGAKNSLLKLCSKSIILKRKSIFQEIWERHKLNLSTCPIWNRNDILCQGLRRKYAQ